MGKNALGERAQDGMFFRVRKAGREKLDFQSFLSEEKKRMV